MFIIPSSPLSFTVSQETGFEMDTMKDKFQMVGKPISAIDLPGIGNQRVSIAGLKGSKNVVVVLLRSKY
jgi:hypothetical protein